MYSSDCFLLLSSDSAGAQVNRVGPRYVFVSGSAV